MEIKLFFVFLLLITLAACSLESPPIKPNEPSPIIEQRVYGNITFAADYPCSAGFGCVYYDGLSVNGTEYLLAKEAFYYSETKFEDYRIKNLSFGCSNDICLVFCTNNTCYHTENNKTYVTGSIRTIYEPVIRTFYATENDNLSAMPGVHCEGNATGLKCAVPCDDGSGDMSYCFGTDKEGNIINNNKYKLGYAMKSFIIVKEK